MENRIHKSDTNVWHNLARQVFIYKRRHLMFHTTERGQCLCL